MNQPLRLVLLKNIPEDEDLRWKWNALVRQLDRPQVFYTYEWALAVQRAYHETLRPLIFLGFDEGDSLCGIAALATDPSGCRVSFLCATTGDYCDFLTLPERKAAFVTEVLAELNKQGLHDITLTNLPADSTTVGVLRVASKQNRYHHFARTAYICAQVSFDRLERQKDGKPIAPGQKRIRRFAKAMAGAGTIRFDHSRSWNAVEPILPEFMEAHVARFMEIGRISNLASARRRLFLAELAKLLTGPQWLVLSRMSAGQRVVAWHYGFQFHDSWFWYQPTFDSGVEKHWPGFCLLTQVIQEATENPSLKMLDLGLGSEAYKAKFANQSRETLSVVLHGSFLTHAAEILRYRLAAAVKAHWPTDRLAGQIREQFRRVRARIEGDGVKRMLMWAGGRLLRLLYARDEVFFFEWENSAAGFATTRSGQLLSLDLKQLAIAAMQNEGDEATLAYLLRSTQRLRAGGVEGFVLRDDDGRLLHFAWVAPFNGFSCSELNTTLQASLDSVIVFDCWTPAGERGHGYYKQAVELIAHRMKASGKQPWIFSAAGNLASLRGLEGTGFQQRYSLIGQRILGWRRISGKNHVLREELSTEVSARVG